MSAIWWVNETQLNDDQKSVIKLPTSGHHLILGPPGCGKTNLLLLRAKFLRRTKFPNIALLTFTKSLRQFLLRGVEQYALPVDCLKTLLGWMQEQLVELGGNLKELPDTFEERRAEIAERLTKRVRATRAKATYDALLVDEAQDLLPAELSLLFQFAKAVFVVGDNRQRIYHFEDSLAKFKSKFKITTLRSHYRCGPKICTVADGIATSISDIEPIRPDCNYRDLAESSVTLVRSASFAEQCSELLDRLDVQLRAYPGELIGVACPLTPQATEVRSFLRSSKLARHVFPAGDISDGDLDTRVMVTTMHSLKGLEFRAVNLLGLEEIRKLRRVQKRVGYTAVTRARTSLVAYWTKHVPGWLEKGLTMNDLPAESPEISDLLGGEP